MCLSKTGVSNTRTELSSKFFECFNDETHLSRRADPQALQNTTRSLISVGDPCSKIKFTYQKGHNESLKMESENLFYEAVWGGEENYILRFDLTIISDCWELNKKN